MALVFTMPRHSMISRLAPSAAFLLAACLSTPPAAAARQMETLDRGLVAVRQADAGTFVSWRMLGTDPDEIAFHLYRVRSGEVSRVNDEPISDRTNWTDDEITDASHYFVRPVLDGEEGEPCQRIAVWQQPFLEIPLQPLDGYRPIAASVGDLDGDGQYDLVVKRSAGGRDNSHRGLTRPVVLDAYKLDGTHLWRIDLGINIRDGEHYTQFMVYDLDGNGRAEIACKTADGSRDGRGVVIGDPEADWRSLDENAPTFGRILAGPEYLTVFDGATGAALQTVDYLPGRDPIDGWGGIGGNGGNDNHGNRCDRFLACVAYLDGERPSLVMCRGVYGRTVLAAWDWRDGELSSRWVFDSGISYPPYTDASPFSGMGGHSLSVADVDGDGRDEIIYQAMTVDDDGTGLYSTGRRHGDSLHVGNFDPARPGLEMFLISENEGPTARFQTPGIGVHCARTGEALWSEYPGVDVGSGVAADIDPRHPGAEVWGGPGGLRTIRGEEIGPRPRNSEWVIWWDGDLLREIYANFSIYKWDWEEGRERQIFQSEGPRRGRYLGGLRPTLAADLFGDWREELILPSPDGTALHIHSTTHPTEHRIRTLMHDPQYRLAIAWQNVVYNKPPHPSFHLGHGMEPPPQVPIALVPKPE